MKKFLSLVLALVMTMSLVTISAGAKDFKDDDKISYVEAVEVMQTVGVIDGFEDGSFKPAEGLTRAQAAKIISNMILGPATADAMKATAAPFKDVPASNWAAGYIAYCASEGIVNGVGNGNFNPNGALTGFEFLKMLLGALGYDAEIEGYVGANWAVNVAKRAIQLGLDDGLVSDLNGKKPATREEACLFALNTLKTPMVEYENTSSVTIGDVVIKNSSKAKEIGSNINTIAAGGKLEFAEKYFKKLSLAADEEDGMGRICNKWTFEGKTESYAKAADYTHMGDTKIYKIYDAMGLTSEVDKNKVYVIEDGVAAGKAGFNLTNKGDKKDEKFGKEAAELSLYVVKNADGSVNYINMVIVNTYIGKVVAVDTDKDGDRFVKVTSVKGGTHMFVTDEFAKDDWVLFTKDANSTDTYKIQSATLAEKMTGKLTMKAGSGKEYVIDGTTYKLAEKAEIGGDVDVKDTVDFYLVDGVIIKIDEAEENVNVQNIAYVQSHVDADVAGRFDDVATLVTAEGKELKKVALKKNYFSDTTLAAAEKLQNHDVVAFSVEDDGTYKLTKKTAAVTADTVTAGKATLFNAGTAVSALDNSTIFVYVITKGTDVSYKVVTGYKNSLTATSATVKVYKKDANSAATVVFVDVLNGNLNNDSSKATVIAYKKNKRVDEGDGNIYYLYNAVVDGKVTTVKVNEANANAIAAAKLPYVVTKTVKADKDNIIYDLGTLPTSAPAKAGVKVSNGIITIGTEVLTAAEDVTVITVDDGAVALITLDQVEEDDTTNLNPYDCVSFTRNLEGEVDYIVLQLAKK